MQRQVQWFGLLLLLIQVAMSATQNPMQLDDEYVYQDPEIDEEAVRDSKNADELQPRTYLISEFPRPVLLPFNDEIAYLAPPEPTTECVPGKEEKPSNNSSSEKPTAESTTAPEETGETNATATTTTITTTSPPPTTTTTTTPIGGTATTTATSVIGSATDNNGEQEAKAKELRILVQHLYIAQARVQLEAGEIKKSEAVANVAQQQLEEAANHVRAVTAALQNAQQEVASAAIRAQTAQLQLAAHDQLLFAARQDVDALSSQMVGLQAAEGVMVPRITFDVTGLLEKLKQPLSEDQKPTAVPRIVPMPGQAQGKGGKVQRVILEDYYE